MENYRHHLSGFFTHRSEAQKAFDQLVVQGLPPARIHLFDKKSTPLQHQSREGSNEVLKEVLVDGAIGTLAGTAVGGMIEVGLIAANVTLFVASPLIAPLILLGWGASMGGFIGATIGAVKKRKTFSALLEDAIANGQVALVAETLSTQETDIAKEIFRTAVGDYQDVRSA